MKKVILFFAILCTIAFVSCTNQEEENEQFEQSIDKKDIQVDGERG
jgi:uncharacterized lipoprotein YehR (DUF1307 family)